MRWYNYLTIFVVALALNLVWESAHFRLYLPTHPIVQFPGVTVAAACLDALWTLAIFVLFRSSLSSKVFAALLLALLIEESAMLFNLWQYKEAMPLVPFLHTGLSPTVQLVVTVLVVHFVMSLKKASLISNKSI